MSLVAVLVLVVESSGAWGALDASLRSLDFDPERAWLIEAWLAGMAFAFLAALITGRPWFSSGSALVFTGLTYVGPLGDRLAHDVPALFGISEQVQSGALHRNQVVVLAVTFLAAIPASATGDLVRREIVHHFRAGASGWRPVKSIVLVGATIGSFLLASSVDPLLRYGPSAGVYSPGSLPSRSLANAVPTTAVPPTAIAEPVPTTGQVRRAVYHSQAMAEDRHFNIYLPPTYGLKTMARRRYPVVFLLHGDPGGPDDWIKLGAMPLFDAGIAQGAIPEVIVVMPDGNGRVTFSTQWANRRDGRDRVEDALIELVTHIDTDYRTVRDRRYRVIAGLSSGGFGAANVAARHPDTFGTAMSFSGYFQAQGPVFGGDPAYVRANSPYDLVADREPARGVRYVLVVGSADPVYRWGTERFAHQLARLGVPHNLELVSGSHGGVMWLAGLEVGMRLVSDDLLIAPTNVLARRHSV